MYHHIKAVEKSLSPSGKKGVEVPVKHGGQPIPFKVIGFTVMYAGDVKKLINGIRNKVKRYGRLIPDKFNYINRGGFVFNDHYNNTVWGVDIYKYKGVRYLNFKTEIQCLQ